MSKNNPENSSRAESKQAYAAPQLTCFGEVRNLTASGTAMGTEQPPGQGGGVTQMAMPPN